VRSSHMNISSLDKETPEFHSTKDFLETVVGYEVLVRCITELFQSRPMPPIALSTRKTENVRILVNEGDTDTLTICIKNHYPWG